jgi:hypothetical protein
MLKVFLKIPGVSRPHAVVGKLLFEDERYLVISQDIIRRKILWENILYVEEITIGEVENTPGPSEPRLDAPEPARVSTFDEVPVGLTDLTVAFTGAFNKLYRIEGVSESLLSGSRWTPDLSKVVFTNAQIKPILGTFSIKECHVSGSNVTIVTEELKKSKVHEQLTSKIDMVQKLTQVATKFGSPSRRPSMKLPTDFSMSGSPFEMPVPMSADSHIDTEVFDDIDGQEALSSEREDQ